MDTSLGKETVDMTEPKKLTAEEFSTLWRRLDWAPPNSTDDIQLIQDHIAALDQELALLEAKSQQRKEALKRGQYVTKLYYYDRWPVAICRGCNELEVNGCLADCWLKLALED